MGKGTDFAERHTAQKADCYPRAQLFSGRLKCPECGGNLNFHFNQKNHDIKFFSCQNHNSGLRKCSARALTSVWIFWNRWYWYGGQPSGGLCQ
ncbi:MAG: zinc ribbon domain-containing protein [Oscillospiraceae bacterium]